MLISAVAAFLCLATLPQSVGSAAPEIVIAGVKAADETYWDMDNESFIVGAETGSPVFSNDQSETSARDNPADTSSTERPANECFLRDFIPQPLDINDELWAMADNFGSTLITAESILMQRTCYSTVWDEAGGFVSTTIVNPTDPAPPPPNAQAIAASVIARIEFPLPAVHFGPDQDLLAVKIPMWIHVTNATHLQDSDSDRGLSVSVSADITSLQMSMGETTARGTYDPRAPEATVTCTTVPTSGAPTDDYAQPDAPCGYTYIWKSTAERTGGTCRWPVTITATWTITWTASNGETGTLTTTRTSQQQLLIREWRSVLVSPGYQPTAEPPPPGCA